MHECARVCVHLCMCWCVWCVHLLCCVLCVHACVYTYMYPSITPGRLVFPPHSVTWRTQLLSCSEPVMRPFEPTPV